jgi:hypothetical protein
MFMHTAERASSNVFKRILKRRLNRNMTLQSALNDFDSTID